MIRYAGMQARKRKCFFLPALPTKIVLLSMRRVLENNGARSAGAAMITTIKKKFSIFATFNWGVELVCV
jgi:hypothetical protein